jgi:hypothetical protein
MQLGKLPKDIISDFYESVLKYVENHKSVSIMLERGCDAKASCCFGDQFDLWHISAASVARVII